MGIVLKSLPVRSVEKNATLCLELPGYAFESKAGSGSAPSLESRGHSQLRPGGSKIESRGTCRPVVTDSHRFNEEQDQDPDAH